MNPHGLRLQCSIRLAVGSRLLIRYDGALPSGIPRTIQGRVVWSRPGTTVHEAGLVLPAVEETWVKHLMGLPPGRSIPMDTRSWQRTPVQLKGRLLLEDGGAVSGHVVNLGVGGMLFVHESGRTISSTVQIEVDSLALHCPGRVVHRHRRSVGLSFNGLTARERARLSAL